MQKTQSFTIFNMLILQFYVLISLKHVSGNRKFSFTIFNRLIFQIYCWFILTIFCVQRIMIWWIFSLLNSKIYVLISLELLIFQWNKFKSWPSQSKQLMIRNGLPPTIITSTMCCFFFNALTIKHLCCMIPMCMHLTWSELIDPLIKTH